MIESSFSVGRPLNKPDIAPQLPDLSEEHQRLLGACVQVQRQIDSTLATLTNVHQRQAFLDSSPLRAEGTRTRQAFLDKTGEDDATLQRRIDDALGK